MKLTIKRSEEISLITRGLWLLCMFNVIEHAPRASQVGLTPSAEQCLKTEEQTVTELSLSRL